MDDESFIDAFGDVPTDLAGDYSQLYIFRAEDFGAWYRRVRDAHEREVDGGVDAMTDAELAEHGLVRLPVDGDMVTIRVGDTLDGYGKTIEVVEMRYGRGGWVLISRDGSGYADTFAFAHRHEPTVEDVLREFSDKVCNSGHQWGLDAKDTIAEYAAKLRLAEGVDER